MKILRAYPKVLYPKSTPSLPQVYPKSTPSLPQVYPKSTPSLPQAVHQGDAKRAEDFSCRARNEKVIGRRCFRCDTWKDRGRFGARFSRDSQNPQPFWDDVSSACLLKMSPQDVSSGCLLAMSPRQSVSWGDTHVHRRNDKRAEDFSCRARIDKVIGRR